MSTFREAVPGDFEHIVRLYHQLLPDGPGFSGGVKTAYLARPISG